MRLLELDTYSVQVLWASFPFFKLSNGQYAKPQRPPREAGHPHWVQARAFASWLWKSSCAS